MKFGQTLQQRVVPQFAAYNINYNELKNVIKTRTAAEAPAEPLTIPGQGPRDDHRWKALEDDLFPLISHEHDRAANFIRVKYGEIERRLTHLEREVKKLQRLSSDSSGRRPIQHTRKYQKIVQDAEEVGDDIQALVQFAGVQRTALRKILKKYKKWTGSSSLQYRVYNELSQSQVLQPEMGKYMQRQAKVSKSISDLTSSGKGEYGRRRVGLPSNGSNTQTPARRFNDILKAESSPLELAAALTTVPVGRSAGRAVYWIHPDNLEEAAILLIRHTRQVYAPQQSHTAYFDNVQRFIQEQNATPIGQLEDAEGTAPSHIAMSIRWNNSEAMAILSDMSPSAKSEPEPAEFRPKDIPQLLNSTKSAKGPVQDFLTLHRDVKPLAVVTSERSTYCGNTNSTEVGNWALLDTDVTVAPAASFGKGLNQDSQPFPHAVLDIRWEFSPVPEVVRTFDSTHLAERVRGFTLEEYAVFTICKPDAPPPLWQPLLEKDIRRIPLGVSTRKSRKANGMSSSGPSSTDGPSDSILSADARKMSEDTPYTSVTDFTAESATQDIKAYPNEPPKRKKTKKYPSKLSAPPIQHRYWNEFDDGSDFEEEEGYAIYVNPDEPVYIPGAETVSKAFSVMYDSFSRGTARVMSWVSLKNREGERQPLLHDQSSVDNDLVDSSSSDEEPMHRKLRGKRTVSANSKRTISVTRSLRTGRPLTARQRAREKILFRTYSGVLVLSYLLLIMSLILQTTGRKKAMLEVDAGAIAGVIAAEACAVIAISLLMMRKQRTVSVLHKCSVGLAVAGIGIWGAVVLVNVALGRR